MYHNKIPRDSSFRVRPDLRAEGLRDLLSLPVEGGYMWRPIGPVEGLPPGSSAPLPHPPVVGGLISDMAVSTANDDHVLVATRGGGVWHTTDGGTTWQPLGDGFPSLQTVTVARVDSGGQPMLLAGTGDLNNEQIRHTGLVGLYRSVDGGRTWSVADGGLDATRFRSHDTNQIWAIDADRILLATRVGLYFSKNGGRNFGNDVDHQNGRPMLRGPVNAISVQGTDVTAIVGGEPTARPEKFPVEIDLQLRSGSDETGLWRATLGPAGLGSFTLAHATRALVAADTVGNTTFDRRANFYLVSAAKREVPQDTLAQFLAASASTPHHSIQFTRGNPALNGDWHVLSSSGAKPVQTQYCHSIALEPLRTGRAAPDAWFGSTRIFGGEIRLNAGRFNWAPIERGTPDIVHLDQHVVQVVPRGAGAVRILLGNDGGFYRTDNGGGAWQTFNRHGAIIFWTLMGARRDATTLRMMGGLQDNDAVIGEGPLNPTSPTQWTWQRIESGGDGGALAWLPQNGSHSAVEDPREAFMTASGTLLKASGTSVGAWTQTLEFESTPPSFPFSEAVAVARGPLGEWDRHYFASSEVRYGPGTIRVRNGAGSFADRKVFTDMVTAVVAAPANPATERNSPPGEWRHVWVGTAGGEVWFSDDAGTTFSLQSVGGTGPVTGIAVDPDDSRRVAVVYGGFSDRGRSQTSAKVFLTENGATFRDISGQRGTNGFVPDIPMLAVVFARTNPVALIVSTDLGVLITTGPQLGQRWSRLGVGLPTMNCPGLTVVNAPPADPVPALPSGLPPVAVGTWGRGTHLLVRPTAGEAVIEFNGGFGPVWVGATERRTLTVRNPGGAALSIASATAPSQFSFVSLPSTPITVSARDHVSLTVACSPTSAGIKTGDLTLTIDGTPRAVAVSCEAVTSGPPRLAMWPRRVNFGPVPDGTTATETIHLKNTGASDLTVTATPAAAGASTQMSLVPAIPPALTLAPSEERTLTARFEAQGTGTAHATTWTISCNDAVVDPDHFQLTATGTVATGTDNGVPTWVWFAIAGGAVVIAAVVVAVVVANDDSDT